VAPTQVHRSLQAGLLWISRSRDDLTDQSAAPAKMTRDRFTLSG
jgi:hypothetical protein